MGASVIPVKNSKVHRFRGVPESLFCCSTPVYDFSYLTCRISCVALFYGALIFT